MRLSRALLLTALAALLAATAADVTLILLGEEDTEILGGNLVDYWPTFAVASNIIIVLLAKVLGQAWLKKPTSYYGNTDDC